MFNDKIRDVMSLQPESVVCLVTSSLRKEVKKEMVYAERTKCHSWDTVKHSQ